MSSPNGKDSERSRLAARLTRHEAATPVLSRREAVDALGKLVRRQDDRVYAVDVLKKDPVLYVSLKRHFGTFTRALTLYRAAGHRWSTKRVISELRRLHRAGVRMTGASLREAGHAPLTHATTLYFGGLVRARRAANIPHPRITRSEPTPWDEDRVIEEILELHAAGESIAGSRVPATLVAAAGRYFGNWQAAIEAAGFDYDQIRLAPAPVDDEQLLDDLRALAQKRPDMTRTEFRRSRTGGNAILRFGSLEKAVERATIRDWPVRLTEASLDAEQLLRLIQRRARSGAPMNLAAVEHEDNRMYHAATRHFGGWRQAVVAAGLEPVVLKRLRWTRGEILEALEQRWLRHESLQPGVVAKELPGLYVAATKHFGSYLAAAGRYGAESRKEWSKERVVAELRRHERTRGSKPSLPKPLSKAARSYFGSMAAAREAGGVPSSRRTWTREAVLEEMRRLADDEGRLALAKLPSGLIKAAKTHFGGIRGARAAAGVSHTQSEWTRDTVLAALRELGEKHGAVTRRMLGGGLQKAIERLFGSSAIAMKEAGVEGPPADRRWSPEVVLDELRALHKKLGKVVSKQMPGGLMAACYRHFGSIPKAKSMAGVPA